MTETPDEVPVLICGSGPAGMVAALLLARFGVASLIVERRSTPSLLPRARGLHARTMEILRLVGVADALCAQALPNIPAAEWRPNLRGPVLNEIATGGSDFAEVSPCEGLAIAQDVFESILRQHISESELISQRWSTELESFAVTDAGVTATVRQQDSKSFTVHARFLLAADGSRSIVRRQLGIAMEGDADVGRQHSIGFRADLSPWLAMPPKAMYFLTEAPAVLMWTHQDNRWAFHTTDLEERREAADIVRGGLGLPELDLEVFAQGRWTAAAQTATDYARPPVFLLGDAVHRMTPAGAMGMSTAIHDSHNLAWKLAFVLSGQADESLLYTYAVEREPVGRRNVAESLGAWKASFNPAAPPFAGRSMRQVDMGFQYRSAAVIGDDSEDADGNIDYRPSAAPGCRAPHCWIPAPEGRRSTIDLFDRDFVLLTGPQGDAWVQAVEQIRSNGRSGLNAHVLTEPEWQQTYGISPAGAVLVRPDGHVGWRCVNPSHPGTETADVQLNRVLNSLTGFQTH